ncbi:MAG: SoxR reducing system RseC family protein [Deltaproteobacteria bacterium]|nr:SoxR reducing system RseC family protein [Deltaproteobacteria bacterium]
MSNKKMMHTRGLVTAVDTIGFADVVMDRKQGCTGCGSKKTDNCKTCLSGSKIQAKVINKKNARKGDIVSVSLSTSKILKGAAVLYLIPVAGLLIGVFTGQGFHDVLSISDTLVTIILGFVGLAMGFYLVRLISEHMNSDQDMMPFISRIIYSGSNTAKSDMKTKAQTCAGCR